jgi:hypothetical protein
MYDTLANPSSGGFETDQANVLTQFIKTSAS